MRIPNSLDDDNLYRRRNGSGIRANPTRRLVRLCLMLAFVGLMMTQAAKPGVYATFFPKQAMVTSTALPVPRSVDETPEPLPLDEARSEIQKLDHEERTQRIAHLLGTHTDAKLDAPTDAAMIVVLQQSLIEDCRDGQVWRSVDLPGLLATLRIHQLFLNSTGDLASHLRASRTGAPSTGMLPLLQQPEVYRGQPFEVNGELRVVEQIDVENNDFGITRYFQCWLRSEDQPNRPWLVIVPELPAPIASCLKGDKVDFSSPFPNVRVVGEFVKRWPYQSASGTELTPIVVGHVATFSGNENPLLANAKPIVADPSTHTAVLPTVWFILGLAVVSGFSMAVAIMWQSRREHRRMRGLRNRDKVSLP